MTNASYWWIINQVMVDSLTYLRNIQPALEASLADTPVLMVVGPRQAGKTTLCQAMGRPLGFRALSLDDAATLAVAISDPTAFVSALDGPTIIDEVQKAPDLLPAIKLSVDRDRRPGRFMLTGSAEVLALPRVSESLAGRMEVHTLWPLSQGEIRGLREGFVDALFDESLPPHGESPLQRDQLLNAMLKGGYPEAVGRPDPERRAAWFGSYLSAILERDVRNLARIEGLTELPRLLGVIAARSTQLLNVADLSRVLGMSQTTLFRYLALLERVFLIRDTKPWSGNRSLRLVKTPRAWLTDTGLLGELGAITPERLRNEPTLMGQLVETFVTTELTKQLGWSRTRAELLHFRTHAGREVDLVLEARDGRVVGVEVKAAATVRAGDFRGLEGLREAAAGRFHRGVVLYTGSEPLTFGENLHALPLAALWEVGAAPQQGQPTSRR